MTEIPQIPKPVVLRRVMPDDYRYGDVFGYTTAQMLAYGKACVEHERKRGEKQYKQYK